MANPQGIIHALRKKIAKLDEVIEELGSDIGNTAHNLAEAQNIIRALKNPDMLIDGDSLTLDRIQVMENGDIREIPPPPEMACVEEVTKGFGKNGKDKAAVAPPCGPQPVEVS